MTGENVDEFRIGLIFSAAIHIGLIAVGVVGMPDMFRKAPEVPEIVSVELVQIAEEIKTKEQPPAVEQPEPAPQRAAREETASSAEAVPPPKAKPVKQAKAEPEPARELVPRTPPRVKPKKPSRFDPTRLAALIDKSIEDKPEPKPKAPEPTDKLEEAVERSRIAALQSQVETATMQSLVREKMRGCWSLPAGAKDVHKFRVSIRLSLTPEGRLQRPPQIVEKTRMYDDDFFRVFAESAARAAQICAPYELPKDRYEVWKNMELVFDPSEMVG
ncbi:MAG: hypothetical protein MI755_07665 [Sphingomonadales bacterium]|nr:hypothetical protein [Sphingomonadales bacterium]